MKAKRKAAKRRCERWVPADGTPTRTARRQGTGTLSMPPLMLAPRSRTQPRVAETPYVSPSYTAAPLYDASYDAGPMTQRTGHSQDFEAPTTRRSGYNRAGVSGYEVHYPHGHIEYVGTKREADRLAMEHYKRSNVGPQSASYGNFERVKIVKSGGNANRVMGTARRRNAPSAQFHAVIDRGGGMPGMFQPEIVGSDASLSTVRVRAKIAADTSGMPVAVVDDRHKVIKVYQPGSGSRTAHGAPYTERTPQTRRYANMAQPKRQSGTSAYVPAEERYMILFPDGRSQFFGVKAEAQRVALAWNSEHGGGIARGNGVRVIDMAKRVSQRQFRFNMED